MKSLMLLVAALLVSGSASALEMDCSNKRIVDGKADKIKVGDVTKVVRSDKAGTIEVVRRGHNNLLENSTTYQFAGGEGTCAATGTLAKRSSAFCTAMPCNPQRNSRE